MIPEFKAVKPDSRILIIQVAVSAVLASAFSNWVALLALMLVIDFLLLSCTSWKVFFKSLITYLILLAAMFGLERTHLPVISNIFPLFFLLMVRVYPVYMTGRILITKAPMDEMLYALERWHIPKIVLIPLSVIYRYIPTISKEIGYIRQSMKMRKSGSNTGAGFINPITSMENIMVPILYRSEKIADELSAASICKGLSTKRKRTCCTDVRLGISDFSYLIAMIAVSVGLFFINKYV